MEEPPEELVSRPPVFYQYQRFVSPKSVRLLTLYPDSAENPLVGTLEFAHVQDAPDYEAVSYVWGDPTRCTTITLDGRTLELTRSLHRALVRLRLTDKPRRLWVDQVCINQDDVVERGQQVRFMNQIYQNANRVLVWLGGDRQNFGPQAFKIVHELYETLTDPAKAEEFRTAYEEQLHQQSEEPWIPLQKFTALAWFNRVWIVQEIGTTAPATLFWGDVEIDWKLVAEVSNLLSPYYHLRRQFSIWTPHIRYLYRRFVDPLDGDEQDQHRTRRNFIYELHRARHLQANDPRDRIYGMLGHYSFNSGSESLRKLEADYTKPVNQTYTDLAILELRGASSLILLNAVQHDALRNRSQRIHPSKIRLRDKMPTWVPNWLQHPMHLIGGPECEHDACGGSRPQLEIDEETLTLIAHGVKIDVVTLRSETLFTRDFNFHEGARPEAVVGLWRTICDKEVDIKKPYVTGDSAFFAFVQTVSNGCVISSDQPGNRSAMPSEVLAHGAAFFVRALERLGEEPPAELTEAAQGGNEFTWSHEATLVSRRRRLARTEKGYFLTGPGPLEVGDVLCVLFGGQTPFLLRPTSDGRYMLVGECYAYGLMRGEGMDMWKQGNYRDEYFKII